MGNQLSQGQDRKIAIVFYAGRGFFLKKKKISACDSDPTELVTPKINKHTMYSCSIFTHSSFDSNKNKHDFSGGQDSIKAFCTNLKNHTTKQYQTTQQK